MWKNMVEPTTSQMTIQYGTCALHAGYLRLQTYTQNLQRLLRFHCNNGNKNAPQSSVYPKSTHLTSSSVWQECTVPASDIIRNYFFYGLIDDFAKFVPLFLLCNPWRDDMHGHNLQPNFSNTWRGKKSFLNSALPPSLSLKVLASISCISGVLLHSLKQNVRRITASLKSDVRKWRTPFKTTKNKDVLKSNKDICGCKTDWTDWKESDTTAGSCIIFRSQSQLWVHEWFMYNSLNCVINQSIKFGV